MLTGIRLRHQHIDVFSDNFIGSIAENLFRGFVVAAHEAFLINSDQAIDNVVEDAFQPVAVRGRFFLIFPEPP